jgi:hypothetical protein
LAFKEREPYVVDKEQSKHYFEELVTVEEQTKKVYELVDVL